MSANLVSLLGNSKDTVCFTGAGMSTRSGIPDFRGTNGLWEDRDPVELSSVESLNKDPGKVIEFWNDITCVIEQNEPNEGHHILARLHKLGLIDTIITQNIDGYHQKASKFVNHRKPDIIELHGNTSEHSCMKCGKKYYGGVYTLCPECGGWIRPDITLYGESLNTDYINRAYDRVEECDLLIVLGSSLTVAPAVDIVIHAVYDKKKIVIINNDTTPLDSVVYGVIKGDIVSVLSRLYNQLRGGM